MGSSHTSAKLDHGRRGAIGGEAEITPAMIDAGVDVLDASLFFDLSPGISRDLVSTILRRALSAPRERSGAAEPAGQRRQQGGSLGR